VAVMLGKLQFWFEFASTYSYVAAMRIQGEAAAARVELEWKPFLLGPIFDAQLGTADSPFNVHPERGRYMWRDLERLCEHFALPWRRPSVFPRTSLIGARVASAAAGEAWCPAFVRAVFRANFAEDRDIAASGVIAELLESVGQPGAAWLARAQSPEAKQLLRDNTERAVALGIFGAPSFTVGSELFWGQDRIEHALAFARG
jgi:2-hydroxychromene-2-carboxylate isomerase